jgi:teichuronic acid biosynthesis glycosyltransferase TuaC
MESSDLRLNVLSVSTNYPTLECPTRGVFVQRRLAALSRLANVRVLVPRPTFPILRPWIVDEPLQTEMQPVDIRRMFYIPKIASMLNGLWMERCIEKWVSSLPIASLKNPILDAHFGFPEGVGVSRVAQRRKLPFFITLRGLETDLFKSKFIRGQMVRALNSATGVIAVSHSLKATAIENGICESKIQVISNGVDNSFFHPGSKEQSRSKLGIKNSAKLIVSVGSIRRLKGFDILLDAIEHFRNDSDFRCVILGKVMEQSCHHEILDRISALGMESCVKLIGAKPPDELIDWLRAADLFVLPTRREGCCNAVLEALSTGIPVITTPAGDNVHYVANGFNGFIVPHESPTALFEAIAKSFAHPWDARSISESIRASTWDGTAEKVHMFFQERLGRG